MRSVFVLPLFVILNELLGEEESFFGSWFFFPADFSRFKPQIPADRNF